MRNDGFVAFLRALRRYVASRVSLWRWRRVDGSLDRKYGVETRHVVENLGSIGATGPHADHAHYYEPIQIPLFRAMMRALPIDRARHVFVDFGSGKGRGVMLAAEYGFKRVVGIEFVPALHAIARENVARFRLRRRLASPIELVCDDATNYVLPPENLVCFLYNPFDAVVMRPVLANMEASLRLRPRFLWLLYRNPLYAHLLDEAGFLTVVVDDPAFRIYRAQLH